MPRLGAKSLVLRELDSAMAWLSGVEYEVVLTTRQMPMVVLVYLMNYIDRNNYAAAKLQGLEEDLNLTPSQYQLGWCSFDTESHAS